MKISTRTASRLLKRVEDEIRREARAAISSIGGNVPALATDDWASLSPRMAEYLYARQQRLDRAYADLESARYGHCRSCGGAIAHERLKADPLTPTCNLCARRNAL